MKKTKIIILTLLFCGLTFNAEAQFLKNLKKQVVERSKDAIINKTANKVADNVSDKVSDQIAGAVNSALGANWDGLMKPLGNMKDMESLPDSYRFDYVYSMNISTSDGELPIDYYLSKSKAYMGAKINIANDMVMIFDDENKALVTFFGGNAIATELTMDDDDDDFSDDYNMDGYKVTNLPNKTFLGYDCIGRLIENDENKMTVYVAQNTEVSFADMFNKKHAKMPAQMKSIYNDDKGGMMMYAEMIDKANNNSKATIECTAFGKSDKVIKIR